MTVLNTRLKPSVVALAALLALTSTALHAQVQSIVATGSYKLDNDLPVAVSQSGPPATSVDVVDFPFSFTTISSAVHHSYGSNNGNFGSRSSGNGVYDVMGSFTIVQSFTNTSASAQRATFNFEITPGSLSNYVGTAFTGSQFVSAGIKFDIKKDSTSIWGSAATLTTNASGTAYTQTGANLYTPNGTPLFYSINGGSNSIDLGIINAGATFTLSYELSTFAQGSTEPGTGYEVPERTYEEPGYWYTPSCGGYGYGGYGLASEECNPEPIYVPPRTVVVPAYFVPVGTPSGSHASSGDPFGIDFRDGNLLSPVNGALSPNLGPTNTVIFAPVPEPGTWALMLSGIGVLGWAARRSSSKTRSS
jgi:hypothetical protein